MTRVLSTGERCLEAGWPLLTDKARALMGLPAPPLALSADLS